MHGPLLHPARVTRIGTASELARRHCCIMLGPLVHHARVTRIRTASEVARQHCCIMHRPLALQTFATRICTVSEPASAPVSACQLGGCALPVAAAAEAGYDTIILLRQRVHPRGREEEEPPMRRLCRRRARHRSDCRAQRHSPPLPSQKYLSSQAASDTRAPSLGETEASATAAAVSCHRMSHRPSLRRRCLAGPPKGAPRRHPSPRHISLSTVSS